MSTPLHHACTRTPVTALALAGRLILAAEGPFLRVFPKDGADCLLTAKIFKNQTVHGLVVVGDTTSDSPSVIAYGGNLVRYIRLAHDQDARTFSLDQGPAVRVSDWVLDVACPFQEPSPSLSSSSPSTTVAVTAHNQIVRLCWTSSSPSAAAPLLDVSDLTVNSRCILYSAHLSWLSAAKVLVASGTAFGEILVWSCDFSRLDKPRSCVHHFFTGHEGSIFGVQISPPFSASEGRASRHQVLASCSDDRTVRVWDISQLPDRGDFSTSDDALGLVQDRETGFGANFDSEQEDCLAVAWGHTSRVWGIRFVGFSPSGKVRRFVSFGEDATSRVWSLDCTLSAHDDLPRLRVDAKLLDTRAFHSGKNIWALDFAASPQLTGFEVCTGAADSAIVRYDWPLTPVESVSPQPTADAHRCCSFVSDRVVISATNSGKLIRGSDGSSGFAWEVVDQIEDLRGYSVSVGLPECRLAFLAGSSGKVYSYNDRTRQCAVVAHMSRKVAGVFASHLRDSSGASLISLVITVVGAKVAESLLLSCDPDSPELRLKKKSVLELPHSFVVTSALYVPGPSRAFVFLGARNGLVAQFSDPAQEEIREAETVQSCAVFELHAPETVTCLSWISHDSSRSNPNRLGHLISTGRNGHYAATEIGTDRNVVVVHQISLPFGPNVEGCMVDKGRLLLYGFRGKHFVVVDASTEQEVFSVECGGAHRIWSFCPTVDGEGGTFVWNQASTLRLHSTTGSSHKMVRSGGHGREIKAAAACPTNPRIVATAAEDTTIRIFEYGVHSSSQPDFRCVRVLRKHVAGVQHLAWSDDGRHLFSSGGYEELFVWRVRQLPVIGLAVVCEAECPPESELPDLRIMGFSARALPTLEADANFLFTLVYSDSTIRTYSYISTATAKTFALVHAGTYLTSCLTQTTHLSPSLLLTAGTDGHIAFWPLPAANHDVNPDAEPFPLTFATRTRIHQSTIKSLAHVRLSSSPATPTTTTLLLTAGDDNAIAFTLLLSSRRVDDSDDDSEQVLQTSTLLIPRAHAATVTSAILIEPTPRAAETAGHTKRLLAVTAGSDQRVKVWEVVIDEESIGGGADAGVDVSALRVRRLADEGTAVADVSDAVVLAGAGAGAGGNTEEEQNGKAEVLRQSATVVVVVVGVGMEAWELDV